MGYPTRTETAPPPFSPAAARAHRWFVWVGLLALAAYGTLIGVNTTIAAGGSDASGYLNSARLLASGQLTVPVRSPPGLGPGEGLPPIYFQPLAFLTSEEGSRLEPTYPTGFPLHVALASKIVGWSIGPRLIQVAAALAALLLCYGAGREVGLTRALAAAAAVVLAASPIMLFASVQPLSDLLATTWCLAAFWAGLRARRHVGWALLCGAAYGIAVLVRPTNIVLGPVLLLLFGLDWRRLALAALGGLPFAGWLAFYNHALYGGALRSGYGNWSEFFALHYFNTAAPFFLGWLAVFLPVIVLVLPVAAFWRRDTRTRELFALAAWFAAITGLHLFVSFAHETWICLRYLLPALWALILAGMLGVEAIARSFSAAPARRLRYAAAVLIAGWAVGMSWHWSLAHGIFEIKAQQDNYITASAAARAHLPSNSVVLSCHLSGALFYYTDFPVLRWDGLNPADFTRYAAAAQRASLTVGAVLFSPEEQGALQENCPGEWIRLATVDHAGVWRLASLQPEAGTK